MLTRRALLRTSAMTPLALVAGCQFFKEATSPQFVDDIGTIATALASILPDIRSITGISAAALARVEALVGQAQTLASQIAGSGGASGLVSSFASVFSSITGTLGISLPGVVGTVLQAAQALLPLILGAAGLALAAAPRPAMAPARARAILQAVAAR